jgi:hypothetical protein
MSHSYRKRYFSGNACHKNSEKGDKRKANRKLRRFVKIILRGDPYTETLPMIREISDIWDFRKDGKSYFGYLINPRSSFIHFPHERYLDIPLYREYFRRRIKGK